MKCFILGNKVIIFLCLKHTTFSMKTSSVLVVLFTPPPQNSFFLIVYFFVANVCFFSFYIFFASYANVYGCVSFPKQRIYHITFHYDDGPVVTYLSTSFSYFFHWWRGHCMRSKASSCRISSR